MASTSVWELIQRMISAIEHIGDMFADPIALSILADDNGWTNHVADKDRGDMSW
jgi:hypothetical protein